LGVPLLDHEEFEVVIMIAVRDRRDGSDRVSGPETDYERALVGKQQTIHYSEMALFFERMLECARKPLDTADIVRHAMFQQQPHYDSANSTAFIDLPVRET